MPVRLRLQRHGRKGKPFYHIVAADARARRDGKSIERIGFYDPNHNPAHIDINVDKALQWLSNGAEPTDTVRSILSSTGVLYKKHLLRGLKKGALTQEQVDSKFQEFMDARAKETTASMKIYKEPKARTQRKGMFTLPPLVKTPAPVVEAAADTTTADAPTAE